MSIAWQPPQPNPLCVAGSYGGCPIADAIAGTTFLCTFLEYHLSGSFAPLFLGAYGGTMLIW